MSAGPLADVLPAAAAALGAPLREAAWALPAAQQVCLLVVDGLGERLLAARGGHAPRLRAMTAAGGVLACGYPSTTATSMGSIGTGLAAGQHGLVGYQVLDPATGRLLNELSWDDGPDPRRWQPHPTVFEHLVASGVAVTRTGPAHFDGSGLTEAALRGGRYAPASSLADRTATAVHALRAAAREGSRALVHVYWGDLDKTGHSSGWASAEWGAELERVDAAVGELAAALPPRALLVVTGDHGMVDVPRDARWDVAADPELAAGVVLVAGEPRAPQLHCAPGAAADVLATWRARLGHAVELVSREEAVDTGWFGPVEERVLGRIGDVVAAATAPVSVHDPRVQRAALADLVGMHGGRTPEEVRVPLALAAGRGVDLAGLRRPG